MKYVIQKSIDNEKLMQQSITIYILSREIIIQVRRFSYFVFHLQRCKRVEDKIKLTLHLVGILTMISELKRMIDVNANEILEMITPKVIEQKLLAYNPNILQDYNVFGI